MFKSGDIVTFDKFGNRQKGVLTDNGKECYGIMMYNVKILSPRGQFGWITTLGIGDIEPYIKEQN